MDLKNKAYPHPYGSTVIPNAGALAGPKLPALPIPKTTSIISDTIGVAAGWTHPEPAPDPRNDPEPQKPSSKPASKLALKFDELLEAFADLVADRVVARLAPLESPPDVEDLNRDFDRVGEILEDTSAKLDELSEARTTLIKGSINAIERPSESGDAIQMHTALEQALREREHVKVTRFAPGPLGFDVMIDAGVIPHMRTCTVYAQPYGGGYTDGAKPDEYVLLCDGRRVGRSAAAHTGPQRFQAREFSISGPITWKDNGYSSGLTFDEVLAAVDGPLRSASWGQDS